MVETLCDSGAVKWRAGANASTTVINSGAALTSFINQAEGEIAVETLCDWVAIYSGLSANYKKVLEGACATKAAIKAIEYNPGTFSSLNEATTMVNILWAEYDRSIRLLSDTKARQAIGGSALS